MARSGDFEKLCQKRSPGQKRRHDALWRLYSQLAESRTPPSDAERGPAAIPMLEVWGGLGDGVATFEAEDALGNAHAAIDAGGCGRSILSGLGRDHSPTHDGTSQCAVTTSRDFADVRKPSA